MIGIYAIRNLINQKIYIGQSTNVEDRIAHHKSALRHNRHENQHLQRSWNKYGEESFSFFILEECNEERLDELERMYISEYKSIDGEHGYNNETGGSLNKHISDEAKRKMSQKAKGRYAGEKNPMYQVSVLWTQERKEKLSKMMSGAGNPMYGVHLHLSDEQRKRISERMSGEKNPFYGCQHTDETKIKMRASNKRKKPIRCVETGTEYESACEAGRQTGFDNTHINACCNGKAHTAYGFHWEFVA